MTESAQAPKTQRFPLLVYEGQWEAVLWPAILVLLGCVAMFLWNPPALRPYGFVWLIAAVLVVALLAYRWWAKRQSYVEVREEDFVVRVPFGQLVVPLGQVRISRPTVLHQHFHREDMEKRGMGPIRPYLGHSAIVVELKEWPCPPEWIRRRLGPYFVAADCEGLVLVVEDWLTLHRRLDVAVEAWRARNLPSPSERFRRVRRDGQQEWPGQ